MWVSDVIDDVACRLNWDDGDDVSPKTRKKIIRGLVRLFDRFSIDGRKLPLISKFEFDIKNCDSRVSIGQDKTLCTWAAPQQIYCAYWTHNAKCGCTAAACCDDHKVRIGSNLSNETIIVHCGVPCGDYQGIGRPTELWYQNGEIAFNGRPQPGDTLVLQALMPFNIQFADQCSPVPKDSCCPKPEFRFNICPSHLFSYEVRESILQEAKAKFNCDPCWSMETQAETCEPCPRVITAKVTAEKLEYFDPEPLQMSEGALPQGYYSALVDILTYNLAPEASVKRTQDMRIDRNEAVTLLYRSNARQFPKERDMTTYWNQDAGHSDYPLSDVPTPGGACC